MDRARFIPTLQALAAAALFGASAPFAKLLLSQVQPIPLAALLYLGSGLGLTLIKVGSKALKAPSSGEATISGSDWLWVFGAVVSGGVFAPILLLFSLSSTPAATASLLLNFEAVATTMIAAVVFREAVGRRIGVSIACVTVASILLTRSTGSQWGIAWGALGVLAACSLWGIDNNLTRHVSGKNALDIVQVKGLGAGSFSIILALMLGQTLPALPSASLALLLGFLGYGLSTVLFVTALRGLGAARTSALYAAAPFVGVIIAFVIFQQIPDVTFLMALPVMIVGAVLLVGERHAHSHIHLPEDHAHRYEPDTHHADPEAQGAHPAAHSHAVTEHTHPHVPDIHHRHDHSDHGGR